MLAKANLSLRSLTVRPAGFVGILFVTLYSYRGHSWA
jgi:hypothetical protein